MQILPAPPSASRPLTRTGKGPAARAPLPPAGAGGSGEEPADPTKETIVMDGPQPHGRRPTVALLGTGRIGRPMARRLLAAGFDVRVWNRTVARAAPLVLDGARVAPFPARAADGADVLLTLLTDPRALHEAARGALPSLRFGAVWLQMGDIGTDQSARLRQLA